MVEILKDGIKLNNIIFALLLTLIAGLATGIGSLISLFARKTNTTFLSLALGFSAGVMIYVSLVEIYAKANSSLTIATNNYIGSWIAAGGFFFGIILIGIIDKFMPKIKEEKNNKNNKKALLRMGTFTAIAIAIHNFPEGLATFISAIEDPSLGVAIAVAIAIHNIPEGIAVSVPIYYATGSRKKAFKYSFLSGIVEPIGAIIGYLILLPIMNDIVFGFIFASVAGIMVFISIDELLPSARKYGKHWMVTYGMVLGMAIMALSLLII